MFFLGRVDQFYEFLEIMILAVVARVLFFSFFIRVPYCTKLVGFRRSAKLISVSTLFEQFRCYKWM